jgi:hypothetical protein
MYETTDDLLMSVIMTLTLHRSLATIHLVSSISDIYVHHGPLEFEGQLQSYQLQYLITFYEGVGLNR